MNSLTNGATSFDIGRSHLALIPVRLPGQRAEEMSMRFTRSSLSLPSVALMQLAIVGPALASVDNPVTASANIARISPLAVVAIYGAPDPTLVCASAAAAAAAQDPGVSANPAPVASDPQAGGTVAPNNGCVLPVTDAAATPPTPPAQSEVAPLLGIAPLLAALGAAGTAAAIAASNEGDDTPVSPS